MRIQRRRHIFSRYRYHLLKLVVPVFVGFSVVDWLYMPDQFWLWLCFRLVFVALAFVFFRLLRMGKVRRQHSESIAVATTLIGSWVVNLMILQSGGFQSLYLPGLILVTTTGIEMFRLNSRESFLAHFFSYFPTLFILFYSAGNAEWRTALIQSSFLLGISVLSGIYRASEDTVLQIWANSVVRASNELEKHRRTEFLKNHFPIQIREDIEKGTEIIQKRKIIKNAVAGFADIMSSTAIGNSVDLFTDWELKERFLEAATRRATASGLIVLTHLGDGFLFLANYRETDEWPYNLISFYEHLTDDFRKIAAELRPKLGGIETGVKFGVAMGPVVVGFIGKDQSYFTAMGPDVNLASRLAALAGPNEIVLGTRVWHYLKPVLIGWSSDSRIHNNVKGFTEPIPAVHIKPRSMQSVANLCPDCGTPLAVIKTEEGFIDFQCPGQHGTMGAVKRIAS